jgi:uncharacterized membrane protein YfcA
MARQRTPPLITIVLACALILTAICVISHRQLRMLTATRGSEPDPRRIAILITSAGPVLGVLVTLSSVGAGAIGMTALVLLYPRTPIARLVGSDVAHAVPLTLIAGLGHWLLGSVNWLLLSSLLIGSLPGIYVGSHFAARRHKNVAIVRTERSFSIRCLQASRRLLTVRLPARSTILSQARCAGARWSAICHTAST